ncbi:MAG: GNAT family N-acetyltransferase, partial [Myxococcota bacterium]
MRTFQIRRLGADEAALLRELRLRALADSPGSFGETYAEVAGRPEAEWRRLAERHGERGPHAAFVAERGEAACGVVFGIADPAAGDAARVGGMWVSAEARGRGVGAALLRAALAWA